MRESNTIQRSEHVVNNQNDCLRITHWEGGKITVEVIEDSSSGDNIECCIEFSPYSTATSGSRATYAALVALMDAIERDNLADDAHAAPSVVPRRLADGGGLAIPCCLFFMDEIFHHRRISEGIVYYEMFFPIAKDKRHPFMWTKEFEHSNLWEPLGYDTDGDGNCQHCGKGKATDAASQDMKTRLAALEAAFGKIEDKIEGHNV